MLTSSDGQRWPVHNSATGSEALCQSRRRPEWWERLLRSREVPRSRRWPILGSGRIWSSYCVVVAGVAASAPAGEPRCFEQQDSVEATSIRVYGRPKSPRAQTKCAVGVERRSLVRLGLDDCVRRVCPPIAPGLRETWRPPAASRWVCSVCTLFPSSSTWRPLHAPTTYSAGRRARGVKVQVPLTLFLRDGELLARLLSWKIWCRWHGSSPPVA
jgi:hypothetical protein